MAHRISASDYQNMLEATLGVPFSPGNRIVALRNGDEIFPPMLTAIENAQRSVELLTFIYWKGDIAYRFAAALAERARAGVQVRVILDAIGAAGMPPDAVEQLRTAGAEVVWFRPVMRWRLWKIDNRTHRKVLVCDGRIAFTGGVGIASEWEGDARGPDEWRDTHFLVEGPAVHGLRAAFIDNWVEAGQPVSDDIMGVNRLEPAGESAVQVVKTTAAVNWSMVATMMRVLLTMAQRKARIATAYFVPDPALIRLLQETAQRGVDLQILIPGPYHDERVAQLAQEHEYAPLMEAGVRLWQFQPSMMHAKIVTVDDVVACVGSTNFNQRSMSKDDEVAMTLIDEDILRTLDQDFETDFSRARELAPGQYRNRHLLRRAKSGLASLFRHQA